MAVLYPFILVGLLVGIVWLILRRRNPPVSLTRIAASVIGIYAGLLGLEHGFFETLQGNLVPSGLMISAIGAPCVPAAAWHACEPALTIIPSFLVTGILAMITALVVAGWAALAVRRKNGGLVLIGLSILMLLVGGGFFPPLFGIIAGLIGTRLKDR